MRMRSGDSVPVFLTLVWRVTRMWGVGRETEFERIYNEALRGHDEHLRRRQ